MLVQGKIKERLSPIIQTHTVTLSIKDLTFYCAGKDKSAT